jgi:cell division protein FtsZ
MGIIEEYADEDASVIFGTTTDESLPEDEVSITIVATGFEQEDNHNIDTSKSDVKATTAANKAKETARPNVIKVVGGENESYYDTPTYLRNQRD